MGPGGGHLVAELIAQRHQTPDTLFELAANRRHVLAHIGVQLDGRFDQLGLDVGVRLRPRKDARRARHQVLRRRVDDLQLELDTKRGAR